MAASHEGSAITPTRWWWFVTLIVFGAIALLEGLDSVSVLAAIGFVFAGFSFLVDDPLVLHKTPISSWSRQQLISASTAALGCVLLIAALLSE